MIVDERYKKTFTTKLYRWLRNGHTITFEKLKVNAGTMVFTPNDKQAAARVILDHRNDIIPTLIHEFLHYDNPTALEEDVIKAENTLANSLTHRQVRNIVKRLAEAL